MCELNKYKKKKLLKVKSQAEVLAFGAYMFESLVYMIYMVYIWYIYAIYAIYICYICYIYIYMLIKTEQFCISFEICFVILNLFYSHVSIFIILRTIGA